MTLKGEYKNTKTDTFKDLRKSIVVQSWFIMKNILT